MILKDIYEQLSFGELRMLFMGSEPLEPDEGMPEDSFMRMLPHIQLGLNALHKRFNLREDTAIVTLMPDQQSYVLAPGKALPKTWDNNLLHVERVYGMLNGEPYEIPLNQVGDPLAIRTTSFNTLLLPEDPGTPCWITETTQLMVVYRADHPQINQYIANSAPLVTDVFLPPTHLEPLLYFIASRVHNPIGMTPGALHEGNNYYQKFEMACQQLENWGFQVDTDYVDDKFVREGWA